MNIEGREILEGIHQRKEGIKVAGVNEESKNSVIYEIHTDILIIGGGAAGAYGGITLGEDKEIDVVIAEKANVKRSGCLAAGVNALNAYINKGETPDSYVDYVSREADGIIREDLTYSIGKNLNTVTQNIEAMGLTILKDKDNQYVSRGKRSIKINGENIKEILEKEVKSKENIKILNHVNIVDYLMKDNRVIGAIGFSVTSSETYVIYAKATICATGGASGVYKPNNPGFSRHKMWYSPFNTGAGYGMGIRAGAEMTTFEMRFVALRCKDTIAPTGTIAQGIKAKQINGKGEEYVEKYGKPLTTTRLFSTVEENKNGSGPCYLKTEGIEESMQQDLFKAYLNMAPAQTLKWIERGTGPAHENVEIEGTEPYIVGGHSGSGYWIDTKRGTTLEGLYAAGDVAGGSPKKYVTGAFVEGEIAANSAKEYIKDKELITLDKKELSEKLWKYYSYLNNPKPSYEIDDVEAEMQSVMDTYAGGISSNYSFNEEGLEKAKAKIEELFNVVAKLRAEDNYELIKIYEIIDRLYIGKVLLHHLQERKETRWRIYGENSSYPNKDDSFIKYINSVLKNGEVEMLSREIVKRGHIYEH